MKTFIELFNTILTADKDSSRQAAREVRKFLYSSHSNSKKEFNDIKNTIQNAPEKYGKIVEDWRQENFVMAISVLYFLHNRENQPDFLFPWLFQLLQHKNGNIRHAAVRMIKHELGSLTYHIRFPGKKSGFHKFSTEQADFILSGLRTNLNNLATSSWKDSYRKFKYIDQIPSGTYKSTQLILSLLDDYCSDVADHQMETETKEQILQRRREIEQELTNMLKETESDFTLDHVQDVIYNEEDNDDMMKVVAMFNGSTSVTTGRGGDATELSDVLELVTGAWNYFPHKILGGISPAEKLLEHHQSHK